MVVGGKGRADGQRTYMLHHPPVDAHLVTFLLLLSHSWPAYAADGLLTVLCAMAMCYGTSCTLRYLPLLGKYTWCLLVRIIEPSNQSRRDPGVHIW